MKPFVLSNFRHLKPNGLDLLIKNNRFNVYGKTEDLGSFYFNNRKISFLLDGFIVPRMDYSEEFKGYSSISLLKELYIRFDLDLINYIKGNFLLVIIKDEQFTIFSDKMGIKKVFYYYSKNNCFIFTNRFKLLTGNINGEVDYESLAIYSLMNHFIGGFTFLKDVFYSKPSSKICFNGDITLDSYWDCEELLNLDIKKLFCKTVSEMFVKMVRSYVDYLNPVRISLTLTGGLDSRAILAALMHMGIKPGTFTYGNPHSGDVITAKKVAQACGLNHRNYFVKPTVQWFSDLADEIVDKGNSMIHIHRAHRLFAVAAADSDIPDNEILFGGYLGGELLRNFYYDGIIVSDFTKHWLTHKFKRKEFITRYLETNFIRIDNVDIDRIVKILSNQKFSGDQLRMNEFLLTFLVIASLYHAQDINLFSYYKRYPIPIYLDIDFLSLIFGSQYNFMHSNNRLGCHIERINNQELHCHLIYQLFPRLASIPLAKRGYYTPGEFVKNNRFIFLAKRLIRKTVSRQKYPVNFSLDGWMKDYVHQQLEILGDLEMLRHFINMEDLLKHFNNNTHGTHEKYWRKYTNPIFFGKLFDFYLK